MSKGIYNHKLHSKETKEKMRISHLGKHRSQETKDKISGTKKLNYKNGKIVSWNKGKKGLQISWCKGLTKETDERIKKRGEKISIGSVGKHLSEEHKNKISENNGMRGKAAWNRGLVGYNSGHPCYSKVRDTKPELMIVWELNKIGIPFYRNYAIIGTPDIYFPLQKLCVFVDGCYWHGCPTHHPERLNRYFSHDIKINEELRNDGYTVLRLREYDIKNNIERCINKIKFVLSCK